MLLFPRSTVHERSPRPKPRSRQPRSSQAHTGNTNTCGGLEQIDPTYATSPVALPNLMSHQRPSTLPPSPARRGNSKQKAAAQRLTRGRAASRCPGPSQRSTSIPAKVTEVMLGVSQQTRTLACPSTYEETGLRRPGARLDYTKLSAREIDYTKHKSRDVGSSREHREAALRSLPQHKMRYHKLRFRGRTANYSMLKNIALNIV